MSANFFDLFGLESTFKLDLKKLETSFRTIQSASHPDRFVSANMAEKLKSMQTSTLANEAYLTLKNPATRAKYLLQLQNIDAVAQTNTSMPADFLMQQMDWRETLEDAKQAKDMNALKNLLTEMQSAFNTLQAHLIESIDIKKDFNTATNDARKLIFIDKVSADIHQAIEYLDA